MVMTERRQAYRRRALMGGRIRFRVQTATLDCLVRNLSDGGARLVLDNAMWLPEQFDLDIRHRDLRVGARVIWRRLREAGIAFMPDAPVMGRSLRHEQSLRVLEGERQALRARVRQLSEEV